MRTLSWAEVWRTRLARHRLSDPAPPERLVDVVGAVCCIHAQVMASAELSIGLRVDRATAASVRAELWDRRSLVKTYGPRGTVHLLPSGELGFWLAALRSTAGTPRSADAPLDATRLAAVVDAVAAALDGPALTRDDLGRAVAARVGAWALDEVMPAFGGMWPRWTAAIGAAANQGALCFGPNAGNMVTFVRPDRWLGPLETVDEEQARREVVRRYLRAYGPASHGEVAAWWGVNPGDGRRLVESAADELEEVELDGERRWLVAGDFDDPAHALGPDVRLLPQFDVYVVGSYPRDRLIPPPVAAAMEARGNLPSYGGKGRPFLAGPTPVLLVDGSVAGIWERRRSGSRLAVTVEPFVELDRESLELLEPAAARLGGVLGLEASLTIGRVGTRPHL